MSLKVIQLVSGTTLAFQARSTCSSGRVIVVSSGDRQKEAPDLLGVEWVASCFTEVGFTVWKRPAETGKTQVPPFLPGSIALCTISGI